MGEQVIADQLGALCFVLRASFVGVFFGCRVNSLNETVESTGKHCMATEQFIGIY